MLTTTITLAAGLFAFYVVCLCIHKQFFHPLSKFPGPKLAAISDTWQFRHWISGRYPFAIRKVHEKYGRVVRISPNHLSFMSPESYKDIYGFQTSTGISKKSFIKGEFYQRPRGMVPGISGERDPTRHAETRKALAHVFSATALRGQSDIVIQYVDLFLKQLERHAGPNTDGVNISVWYELLTFDIIGDLAFGEPFGGVENAAPPFWVSLISSGFFYSNLKSTVARLYPFASPILPYLAPKGMDAAFKRHFELTREKTRKRISMGDTGRPDFFSKLLDKFPESQLIAESNILITGGSETTSTALAGMTYYLLKNPETLQSLQQEVRAAFDDSAHINGDSTTGLKYLNAVIEEGLRIFSPAPFGLPRIVPKEGAMIDGFFVPGGSIVSTDSWTAGHSEKYWSEPDEFHPERWVDPNNKDNKDAIKSFSLGPRGCLGINLAYLEMRIILAKIIWNFDMVLMNPEIDFVKDIQFRLFWVKPEIKVQFRPRNGL